MSLVKDIIWDQKTICYTYRAQSNSWIPMKTIINRI